MHVSGHKSKSGIRSYSRRLSEVKQKEISPSLSSACCVENLESTSTAIVVMHEQPSENFLWKHSAKLPCDYAEFRISYPGDCKL